VFVVDDDSLQLDLVQRTLQGAGFEVSCSSSPIGATNLICSFLPDIVLMDVNIPGLSGDALVSISRKWAPKHTRFVLYSASDEAKLRNLARAVGAHGWISKSVTGSDLVNRLRAFAAGN